MTRSCRYMAGILILVWVIILLPAELLAGEVIRKVSRGESLSQICQETYGDKDLYSLVALYNGKDDPTKLSPGETLRLPYSGTVTLHSGESLSILAKRLWSEPKMYPVLAWANGVQDTEKIPVGTRLAVPVLIPYPLKKGESISTVAEAFYGNPKVYEVIINASRVGDPTRIPAGTLLKIPYVMPRPVAKKTPVSTTRKPAARPSPKPAPEPVIVKPEPDLKANKALNLLEQAESVFRAGQYGDAWTMGNEASRDLQGRDKARALRLLAASQYAFGRKDAALDDLRRAYDLDPDFKPDPAYVNPEMLELYRLAGDQ